MADYIAKIKTPDGETRTIGGKNFDGQWIIKYLQSAAGVTVNANATATYSLASYLPNDGYDYEINFMASGSYYNDEATGGLYSYAGTGTGGMRVRLLSLQNHYKSWDSAAVSGFQVISASDRNITIQNPSSYALKNVWIVMRSYRRIGRNT